MKKNNIINPKLEKDMFKNLCKEVLADNKIDLSKYPSFHKQQSSQPTSEADLLVTMTKRMKILESQLQENNKLLKEKIIENDSLKTENEELKNKQMIYKMNINNCSIHENNTNKLKEYTLELQDFIKEQGFHLLKDPPELEIPSKELVSGVVVEEIDDNSIEESTDEQYNEHNLPKQIDINVIKRRIDELNIVTYKDGNTKFEADSDKIFKLKQIKELKIYFFKNGLCIETYKFYDYNSSNCKKILQDILEGYIPFILKDDYPNGVPLIFVNEVKHDYDPKQIKNDKLGGLNNINLQKEKISKEELISKLPNKIIKNGRILDIKGDMETLLSVKKTNELYYEEKEEIYIGDIKHELENECKLKIKLNILDKTITVNINKNDLMKEVFNFIKVYVNKELKRETIKAIDSYVLYSTYPYKQFFYDNKLNMAENGLFPSYYLVFDDIKSN